MDPSGFEKLMSKNVPHIHEKILLSMDYDTFKNSKGVCKIWDELLESETFTKRANSVFRRDMERELFRYSRDGEADKAKSLLSKGVDANCNEMGLIVPHGTTGHESHMGLTPLWWAARNGHTDVVQMLLYHGANPNIAMDNQKMLLQAATKVRLDLSRRRAVHRAAIADRRNRIRNRA